MGMGMAAAPVFSSIAQQMFGTVTPPAPPAPEPGLRKSKFDIKKSGDAGDDFADSIKKLKTMLDLGAITQAQYDTKIQEIMSRM